MSRIVIGTGPTGVSVNWGGAAGNIIGKYSPVPTEVDGDESSSLEKDGSHDRVSVAVFTSFSYYRNYPS